MTGSAYPSRGTGALAFPRVGSPPRWVRLFATAGARAPAAPKAILRRRDPSMSDLLDRDVATSAFAGIDRRADGHP